MQKWRLFYLNLKAIIDFALEREDMKEKRGGI